MKKYLFFILCVVCCLPIQGQEYIQEEKLFLDLVKQVQSPNFDLAKLAKVYETSPQKRINIKLVLKTLKPSSKILTRQDLYKKNKPNVYRFVKIFLNGKGNRIIENISTAFPITEDGFFCINFHMAALLNAGTEDPSLTDTTVQYFLADFGGNILAIDSIASYNQMADVAIIKANTAGKKIAAFALGDDLEAGDDVFVIAHPKAYLYYFSAGMVNRMTQGRDSIFSRKMEISADYAGGSSGGPIFDAMGNIAGMVCSTQSFYYYQKEQKSLQMVVKQSIPVSVIKALIKE